MKTVKRVFAAIFGAILFGIIVPIGYFLAFHQFPFDSLTGIALVAGIGAVLGAILGVIFPRVFGFIFESFLGQ
jgi:hypothetical protein